ncbi:MAG: hypothetical protein ACLRUN_05515 [Christensenellales bacterium]
MDFVPRHPRARKRRAQRDSALFLAMPIIVGSVLCPERQAA